MTGAPALALLLLGQLLTATSAQVSADRRVLMGSGIGAGRRTVQPGITQAPWANR